MNSEQEILANIKASTTKNILAEVSEKTGVDVKLVSIIMAGFFSAFSLAVSHRVWMRMPGIAKVMLKYHYYKAKVHKKKPKKRKSTYKKLTRSQKAVNYHLKHPEVSLYKIAKYNGIRLRTLKEHIVRYKKQHGGITEKEENSGDGEPQG